MEHQNVEHLVIFSTLNQITNHIAIKQLRPKNIHNITFHKGLHEQFKYGINPEDWDKNLKDVLKNEKDIEAKVEDIKITECMYKDLEKFKDELLKSIKNIDEDTPIYWHITGGQRVFAMPIYDIVNNLRPNDILFYLEGNTEEVISMGQNKDNTYNFKSKMKYELNDLDFETAFRLMGFDFKGKINSTLKLKEKGEVKKENINHLEQRFYNALYQWMVNEGESQKIKIYEKDKIFEGTFKELLLGSNSASDFISKTEKKKNKGSKKIVRQEFLKKLFEKVQNKCPSFERCNYNIAGSNEMDNNFPAGYIFEKIVGYQIFEIIKDDPKILGMDMSLKVYKDEFSHCVDELDIALLTNTGRILNFECKSGNFEGDNAKSHHFTTYALSGVFGAPIFMTPLSQKGEDLRKDINDKLVAATRAGKKANIKTIYLKEIDDQIKKLI